MTLLWQNHIFVCCNQRDPEHARPCCGEAQGGQIRIWFQDALKRHGLAKTMRANKSGCLEACEAGPAVVVYPEGAWYRVNSQEDVEEIVREHLIGGNVVTRLTMSFEKLPAWRNRKPLDSGD